MENSKKYELRTYDGKVSCVFRKTKEQFGGLSNMASGFPLRINGIEVFSSEALYQACRFPHLIHVQEKILKERSPMTAKMVSKPYRGDSRKDWDETRTKIMRWCLRVKLAQNFIEFGKVLESTGDRPIVEDSGKDIFWGTIRDKVETETFRGVNALGRLLMELRKSYNDHRFDHELFVIEPPKIPDFTLLGEAIGIVDERDRFIRQIEKSLRIQLIFSASPVSSVPYSQTPESLPLVAREPSEEGRSTTDVKKSKRKSPTKKASNAGQASLPF